MHLARWQKKSQKILTGKATAERESSLKAELLAIKKAHPDLVTWKGTVAEVVDREIYEIENLAVGREAPDIVGKDLHGQPLRLADHRGKVVVLEFYGDW